MPNSFGITYGQWNISSNQNIPMRALLNLNPRTGNRQSLLFAFLLYKDFTWMREFQRQIMFRVTVLSVHQVALSIVALRDNKRKCGTDCPFSEIRCLTFTWRYEYPILFRFYLLWVSKWYHCYKQCFPSPYADKAVKYGGVRRYNCI